MGVISLRVVELFTAKYKIETGEITGCTKYGIVWKHEKGHEAFRKTLLSQILIPHWNIIISIGLYMAGYTMAGKLLYLFAWLCILIEEIYAWYFALTRDVIE